MLGHSAEIAAKRVGVYQRHAAVGVTVVRKFHSALFAEFGGFLHAHAACRAENESALFAAKRLDTRHFLAGLGAGLFAFVGLVVQLLCVLGWYGGSAFYAELVSADQLFAAVFTIHYI